MADYKYTYSGTGGFNSTQDKNEPIKGTKTEMVTQKLQVRSVNRSPNDVGKFRGAHIVADSVTSPNSSRLFDIYDDILRDLVLRGLIRKRISQVVNKRLIFLKGGKEDMKMKKVIKSKAFKGVMKQIMWAKMWGVNGLEFIPGPKLAYNLIPKKHIKRKTQKITIEQSGLENGVSYVDLKNIWILGEPGDLGELLMCGFMALLKKGNISDWAQYIELFGSPAIVVKYKGYDQQAKLAADRIMDNVANSMRMVIPEEMNITFEDGKIANGDGKLQDTFRKAVNEELSIFLLGNTETTGHSGTGTGAKSETHASQQMEIIKDDMDDIVDLLNSDHFMDILRSYGMDVDGGEFDFDREVDIAYNKEQIVIVEKAANLGLEIPKNYMYELLGIPKPEAGDDIIKIEPALPVADTTPPTPSEKGAAKPKGKKGKLTVDDNAPATIKDVKALLHDFFGPAL